MLALVSPTRPVPVARAAPDLAPVALFKQADQGADDPDAPTVAQQRTAYRGLVATLTRLRADAVAGAMLAAAVEREVGPAEFEPVDAREPWPTLLRQPNPAFSARHLWHWAQQAKDLGRGAFFRVERDTRGVPLYLWPIFPAFGEVRPIGAASGSPEAFRFLRADGRRETWPARDVVWLRHPHPVSPFESASLLEIAAYEADADLWQHVYGRDLVKRGGAAQVQVTTDQDLQPADQRELGGKLWRTIYEQESARTVPVFTKGASAKAIGINPRDMQMLELRGLTRTELFNIFGVPEGLLDKNATEANSKTGERVFAQWTVQPQADAFCDQLTTSLRVAFAPEAGPPVTALCVVAPGVVPLDPDFALRRDEVHLRTGQRTVNELRERDGEPEVEGGDVPLTSAALLPLARVAEPPERPAPPASAPPQDDDPDDDGAGGAEAAAEDGDDARAVLRLPDAPALLRALGITRSAGTYRADDAALAAEWRAVDDAKRLAELPIGAAAAALFRQMGDDVAGRLRHGRAHTPDHVTASAVFDVGSWVEEVVATLSGPVRQAIAAGWDAGALRVDADLVFDADLPAARRALAEIVAKTRSVPETAHGMLETALRDGLAAGEETAGLAARVRALFSDLADWKARQIAQTAGTGAFEAGQVESWKAAGVARQRWLSARDGQVRDSHDAVDGEEVEAGAVFSNGLRFPSDPAGDAGETVNCRCTLLPVSAEPRALSERDAWIVSEYADRVGSVGRGVALAEIEEALAEGAARTGWAPIGQRQILRIAKGHD